MEVEEVDPFNTNIVKTNIQLILFSLSSPFLSLFTPLLLLIKLLSSASGSL